MARAFGPAELHVSGEIGYANHGSPREWTYGAGAVVPAGHWRMTLELDGRNDEGEKRLLLTPGALARLTLELGGPHHHSPGE